MNKEELINYINTKVGVPYSKDENYNNHSLDAGFGCITWALHIFNKAKLLDNNYIENIKNYRVLFKDFVNIKDSPRFLDIALFHHFTLDDRHIGVMLDESRMSHCSINTNGVATSFITRQPWSSGLQGFYRYRGLL